jgi:hypothetical protein
MEQMTSNLFTTLEEARNWLLKNKQVGAICPCCAQLVKVYKRKLNASMAVELISLYKLNKRAPDAFFHHKKFIDNWTRGGDFAKLLYWDLIQEQPKDPEQDKRTSGTYRITQRGIAFVERLIVIPTHCYVCTGQPLGFSEEQGDIVACLDSKFSYSELMSPGVNVIVQSKSHPIFGIAP